MDAAEKVLTLAAEGPSMSGEGMAKYHDVIEIMGEDERTLTSHLLGDDGQRQKFMTARYRRKK